LKKSSTLKKVQTKVERRNQRKPVEKRRKSRRIQKKHRKLENPKTPLVLIGLAQLFFPSGGTEDQGRTGRQIGSILFLSVAFSECGVLVPFLPRVAI
jgi:arginine utilization protein RocB